MPDAAFLVDVPYAPPVRRTGKIGVVISGNIGRAQIGECDRFLAQALAAGHEIDFLSTEPATDATTMQRMVGYHERHRGRIRTRFEPTGFRDFCGLVHDYDCIVTMRLHAAVLALCSGVPCVAIESENTKNRGALACAGLDRFSAPDPFRWSEFALEHVSQGLTVLPAELSALKATVRDAYLELL